MPMQPSRACLVCAKATESGKSYCPDHINVAADNKKERDQLYDNSRADDPIRKLYNTAAWKRFRQMILSRNPRCQRLLENWANGGGALEQCHEEATEVHHFISPRERVQLFMESSNVAGVCRQCHHKHQGEPNKNLYVPTVAFAGLTGY
jgi:hypothetical protein